ncbi:MAG TPA: Tol-Pal system protein TolB [Sulfurovum sp.]|nr:Tol-Pal system protein TolB [Sulfurovum sp.]
MKYLLFLLLSLNLFAVDATVKIEKDVEDRARIALVDASTSKNNTFFKILLADLKISGHFIADTTQHKGDISSNYLSPTLKSQEYVLKYNLTQESGTKLLVKLIKASDSTEVFKKSYAIPSKNKMPFLAHKAVSDINKVLKYPDISWMNRYVIYARYTTPGKSEIVLADYTFNYKKSIIKGGLNLFPKWADKDQKSFYYSSYNGLKPILYKMNIYTGKKEKMATSEGMLVCSDVSKDGRKLLLTMAPEGQADIYELDVASKAKKRVTKFNGIDVNGKYLGDESSVVFVSDRLGYANVFKKGLNTSSVSQVVYHGRNNNAVDAHGSKIVYASRESQKSFGANKFNIYLTSSTSTSARPLTTTGTNQFPKLSVDGNVILYIKHRGNSSSVGYINLESQQSLLFPISGRKIQSIDW